MAGGGGSGTARELDRTPTWAVAAVCAVIIIISIILEKVLHIFGKFFQKKRKRALFEALEKVKGELMVLGFISLLLSFTQNYISRICIPKKFANTMLPCPMSSDGTNQGNSGHHRRLLWYEHRLLAGAATLGCPAGKVPLISLHGLHQLHIFIFFLAVFHVMYGAITMMLGRMKIRRWKVWEKEAQEEQDNLNDPNKFRLTKETSFVRDHSSVWTKTPVTFYTVCFFRQFLRSVREADYMTMRHGFITVHLAPGSKFNFQKYIKRSLEDDFKVVVGINPLLWASVVLYLLVNVTGWHVMVAVTFFPLVVILAVGTKLQAIITQMALEIKERHAVVQGMPLVQVSDRHFWFSWPQLVLYLIHFVLFQNAFEITYFFWIWYEFGLRSCFHDHFYLSIVRVALGVGVQFMCSYITLPLYALVTQMGSTMKMSIFDEQTSKRLLNWRMKAMEKTNERKTRTLGSPRNSLPSSPAKQGEKFASASPRANTVASVDIPGEQPPFGT